MKKMLLALMVGLAFSVSTLADPPGGYGGGDREKPEGESGEEGGDAEHGGEDKPGGKTTAFTLTGVLTVSSGSESHADGTLTSTSSDENVILVQSGASLTVSNYTLNKSGNGSNEDNSNFFAVNAVVAANTNATVHIDNSRLNSNASGANMLFATGAGSTIYAYPPAISQCDTRRVA